MLKSSKFDRKFGFYIKNPAQNRLETSQIRNLDQRAAKLIVESVVLFNPIIRSKFTLENRQSFLHSYWCLLFSLMPRRTVHCMCVCVFVCFAPQKSWTKPWSMIWSTIWQQNLRVNLITGGERYMFATLLAGFTEGFSKEIAPKEAQRPSDKESGQISKDELGPTAQI